MVKLKSLINVAATACASAFCACASAQEFAFPVWVNAGLLSYHADRNQGYRENNWGLGFETMFNREHGIAAGTYLNSEHARSNYIGYQWRPLYWNTGNGWNVSAGLSVNAIDGYPGTNNGGWFIAPLPVVSVEYKNFGVNFVAIPHKNGGAIAAQFKLRVW